MSNQLGLAITVAANELRQLSRSRSRLLLSLVIIPLFFTIALGGTSGAEGSRFSTTADVPMAYVDEDISTASGRLYHAIIYSRDFNHLTQGYHVDSALKSLGTGKIFAAIIISKGFEKDLLNNQTTRVILYVDDAEPNLRGQIVTRLETALREFNPRLSIQPTRHNTRSGIQVVQRSRSFSGFAVGITITLAIVQIFATFFEIAGGISRDREEGTYARLLLSQAGIGSIVLGKTLYDLFLNIIRTMIVLGIATLLYGARLNAGLETILAISLLIALVTMGFGFLASSLKIGIRAVVILEFLLVISLFTFSGLIIDRELLRGSTATISSLLPWSYGIDALRGAMLTGKSLLDLSHDLQVMGASVVLLYIASYILLLSSRERLVT